MKLNELKLNSYGIIYSINSNPHTKRRFLDLGLIKGTIIKPVFRSPFNDPTAYEINNTIIAIRKEDANKIDIIPLNKNTK